MTRTIKTKSGDEVIVDDENFEWLSQFAWYTLKGENTDYAATHIKGKTVLMHKLILPGGDTVDHINRNGMDNVFSNLRHATRTQQQANRRKQSGTKSRYKGVSWHSAKWKAYICYKGKYIHLGYLDREEDAAKAYDKAARELFGEFALLNFPDNQEG